MIKRIDIKDNWKEIEPAFIRNNIQHYYLRINKVDLEDESISYIEEIYDHYPSDEDKSELTSKYLGICKVVTKSKVIEYANSSIIKNYTINSIEGWENSDSRLSIRQSATDKKNAGINTFILYHGETAFESDPDTIIGILASVEIYASNCYQVTENHKATIDSLSTINDVESYDFTTNYPSNPSFLLN